MALTSVDVYNNLKALEFNLLALAISVNVLLIYILLLSNIILPLGKIGDEIY